MKAGIIVILFILKAVLLPAQEVERTIQKGNELFKQNQYPQAEAAYTEALDKDATNAIAKYNRAIALQKQGRSDEAIRAFDDLAFKTEDREMKAKAYYNKGAILSAQKKLEESIEEYKNALRHDPGDKNARENLQKALMELKKKNPPKKNDKKKQQKQQQKPQPKMNQKEAEQRLKLLEQKEKEVQQRLQKEKSKTGGGQPKDW